VLHIRYNVWNSVVTSDILTSDLMFSEKILMSDVVVANLMLTRLWFCFPYLLSFQDENKLDSEF